MQEVIESGKFDDKEDFTVVYQPFFHDTHIPKKEVNNYVLYCKENKLH